MRSMQDYGSYLAFANCSGFRRNEASDLSESKEFALGEAQLPIRIRAAKSLQNAHFVASRPNTSQ